MDLRVVKFGGSTLGEMGAVIPVIINRIRMMSADSKVLGVFSAPLTREDGRRRSLTDVVLSQGSRAEQHVRPDLSLVRSTYQTILEMVSPDLREQCKSIVDAHLDTAQEALDEAHRMGRFADSVRGPSLGILRGACSCPM